VSDDQPPPVACHFVTEHRDAAGSQIEVGDLICYAALWSRSATLRFGRVLSLNERAPSWPDIDPTPTIRAVTVDRGWKGEWELQKSGGPVALGFLDRLLVVPPECVPDGALALLQNQPEASK
jgi:hypothetical protein